MWGSGRCLGLEGGDQLCTGQPSFLKKLVEAYTGGESQCANMQSHCIEVTFNDLRDLERRGHKAKSAAQTSHETTPAIPLARAANLHASTLRSAERRQGAYFKVSLADEDWHDGQTSRKVRSSVFDPREAGPKIRGDAVSVGRDHKTERAPMQVKDAGMGISLAELRQAKGYETVNPVNLSRSGLQLMRALLEQQQRNQQSVQQLSTWAEKLWMSQLLSCGTVMALTAGPFQGHWLVVRGGPWMVRALALEVDANGGMWKVVHGLKEIPITNEGMVKIFKVDW